MTKDKAKKKAKRKEEAPAPTSPAPRRKVFAGRDDAAGLPAQVKAMRDAGALWRDVAVTLDLGPGKTGTSRARRLYRDANAGAPAPRKQRKERQHGPRIVKPRVAHVPFAVDDPEDDILAHIEGRKVCWQGVTTDDTGLEPMRSEREAVVVPGSAKVLGLEMEDTRSLSFVDPLYGYRECYLRDIHTVRDLTPTEEKEIHDVWVSMGKVWTSHGSRPRPADAPVTKSAKRRAKAKAGAS